MRYAGVMSREPRQKTNVPLALFATILVVCGVALVAYVASQKPVPAASVAVNESSPSAATSSLPALLLVDAGGAKIVWGEKSRTLAWPEDVKLLGQSLSTLEGRMVDDGRLVALDPEYRLADSHRFRSPDGRHEVLAAKARSDGTGAVDVIYGKDTQSIVIRLTNGTAVRSVIPVGWWDNDTIAVSGMVTSSRALFAVPLVGPVTQVAYLSDTYEHLVIMNGLAYYVTVTAGEGLEAESTPPSSIVRVLRSGTVETLATEPNRLVDRVVVHETGVVAYHAWGEGSSRTVIRFPDGRTAEGIGDPLAVLDDGRLISRQALGDAVRNGSSVFVLPKANLDEIFGTK